MTMLQNCNTAPEPKDEPQTGLITTEPDTESDDIPASISVSSIPEAIAKLDKRSQMIVTCLASGLSCTDIGYLCRTTSQAIQMWINRHGLRELVSVVTPEAITAFRAARWQQVEARALTQVARKADDLSGMQAVTTAAIATDKIAALHNQMANAGDGRGTGDILLSIKARISR